MTDDLVVWLRAQLAYAERVARDAGGCSWDLPAKAGYPAGHDTRLEAEEEHTARHDPARVLAEVDAKRRILDLHEGDHECSTIRRGVDCEGEAYEEIDNYTYVVGGDCSTVRLLALPFADRPGYREEWRP